MGAYTCVGVTHLGRNAQILSSPRAGTVSSFLSPAQRLAHD